MAENDVCLSEQEDEILALSSIFGDEFSRNEYEECSTIYEIKIPINLPEKRVQLQAWLPVGEEEEEAGDEESRHGDENNNGEEEVRETLFPSKKIQFRRSESKRHSCLALSLSHLAPLRLEFSFPKDYPSSSKPLFTLSCLWLDKYHLGCLCRQLDEQWESSFKGQAVVFPWVDWLQNSSLEFLGFSQAIFLKPFEWGMDCECDPRGIPEFLEPKTCALKMLEYDFQMQQREFQKESHVCEICFEEHEGILFHFLPECGHKFCVECLLDYCQMHVNEGTVRLLKCPERECKSALSPIILRELLNDEDFERWERLLFQQTLDSMVDILYCPRCNSVVVQDEDKESKLAQCGECFFIFCTECLLSWHSAQPCGNEDVLQKASKSREKRQKLKPKSKYQTTQEADKLVSAHPKSAMMKSYDFLLLQKRLGNYQRCPKCRIMVEKTQGCNMMHCSRCGQKFCWSCGNKVGGYKHFSTCNNAGNNIHDRGRQMLANRPVAGALLRMNELQTVNPGVAMKLQVCPQCRQRNMKEFRNNHMKCWACRTDFCYHCGKKTGNPVSSHFKVSGTCKQHSDD